MSSPLHDSQASPPVLPGRRTLALLVLAILVIWFCNLDYRKLIDPDEGRYAEIPREMVVSGDWLTPRLNGFRYFEKPPLQYWATATAYTLFGEHHWTARLWSALTSALGVVLVFFAGRALFGTAAGFCSALALVGSIAYSAAAQINSLDAGLTFFMSLALCALMVAVRDGASAGENRTWMLVAWAAMALAMLSKGLIGIVLPAAIVGIYILIHGDWALLRRLRITGGLAVFTAIAAPWFVLVQRANPGFFEFFFVHEHFQRYLTTVHSRVQPWWFFLPILVVGILPWIVTLFETPLKAWRSEAAHPGFRPRRFLLIWAAFILVFFSASHSKLPSYTLPMFPALALLIGERLSQLDPRTLRRHLLPAPVFGLALLGAAPVVYRIGDADSAALYQDFALWIAAAGAAGLFAGAWALYRNRSGRAITAITTAAFCGLVVSALLVTGFDSFSPSRSSYYAVRQIAPYLRPGVPFYSVGIYDQTLPYYLKRTVTLVLFRGELDMGIRLEPQLWLPDLQAFAAAWRQQREALAILHPAFYDQLAASGLPMQVLVKDSRRVIVKTP